METLLIFTFKDLIAFAIPVFVGGLIFNRRRKLKEVRVSFSFLWIFLIVGSFLGIYDDIYTTYSYRHNHLYNNDKFTTIFNYDVANIVFFVILIFVSIVLLLQELRLKKSLIEVCLLPAHRSCQIRRVSVPKRCRIKCKVIKVSGW